MSIEYTEKLGIDVIIATISSFLRSYLVHPFFLLGNYILGDDGHVAGAKSLQEEGSEVQWAMVEETVTSKRIV